MGCHLNAPNFLMLKKSWINMTANSTGYETLSSKISNDSYVIKDSVTLKEHSLYRLYIGKLKCHQN